MERIKELEKEVVDLKGSRLRYKVYNNQQGGASSVNNNARTQEIILDATKFDFTSFVLYIENPSGANEVAWVYDMGKPYLTAVKLTYYGDSGQAGMVLYRHTVAGWSTPRAITATNI